MPYQNCQTHQCLVTNTHWSQETNVLGPTLLHTVRSGVNTASYQIMKPQAVPVTYFIFSWLMLMPYIYHPSRIIYYSSTHFVLFHHHYYLLLIITVYLFIYLFSTPTYFTFDG